MKINWGIIGCGDVTEVKSGPAFSRVKGSSLVAVMRRNGKLAEDYAKRHGVPRWYDDAGELINDNEVNAVYIATPPHAHEEYALQSLNAGKPVYVEKPMALNIDQSNKMVALSRSLKIPLFVAYYRRCLPGYVKIKELIENDIIGKVRLVSIRMFMGIKDEDKLSGNLPWRVIPSMAGGGYFVDLASHQLDYLDYLFGPVTEVAGFADNQAKLYPAEDIVSGSFKFPHGVIASGIWCFTASNGNDVDTIEIIGEKGKVTFSTFQFTPIVVEVDGKRKEMENPRPAHVHQPLVETIVDELNGKGKCPSTGISGARTTRVMEQLLTSYYS